MDKCLAVIPARGGSKRIPKKNIKDFHGKPLIAYSIETAIKSDLFDKVIVSTDDEEIANIAKKYGAEIPFIRPKELADDYTGTMAVTNHAIKYFKSVGENFDYVCTIYATAPFLQIKYLKEGFEKLKNSDAVYAFSATSMPYPIWRTFKTTKDNRCEMFFPEHYNSRSQDLEEAFQDAGQFYWQKLGKKSNGIMFGKDSIPIILPRYLVQDIDTLEDWKRAEIMYKVIKEYNLHYKMAKNILIRADSSSTIGTGHIMRDLVLVKRDFKDDNVIFAVRDLEGNINHKITEAGYKIEILKSNDNDIEELNQVIKKHNIDMIVIDNYEIDYEHEKQLSIFHSQLSIMILDDTYEKHYCDILLNHNISADEKRYKNLVPTHCRIRCGAKYTLLRDEFYKEKKIKREKIYDFFIAMGGADHSNINIKILDVLKEFRNIKVAVATTTANKNLKKLIKYTKNKPWIDLYINSNEIAKLMNQSKYAIITPSVIINEVYFMGLSFIAIKTANNQIDMYQFLKQKKFLVLNKFNKYRLKKMLWKML